MRRMVSLTTITFFKFKKNKPWAFTQMGLLHRKIQKTNGLFFLKLLGTGGGNGFSLRPDFGTYALLGVWESENAASDFYSRSTQFVQNHVHNQHLYNQQAKHYQDSYMDTVSQYY